MGFGLAAIGEILKSYDNPQALAEFLAVKQAEVQIEAAETSRRLLLLATAIERLRKDETAMNYNVTLKTLPERYVASVRKIIPAYEQEGMLWGILMEETDVDAVPIQSNISFVRSRCCGFSICAKYSEKTSNSLVAQLGLASPTDTAGDDRESR